MNAFIYFGFILLFGLFLVAAFFSLRLFWDFRATDRGVEEYVLGFLRVRTIPFDQIEGVRLMTRDDLFPLKPRRFAGNRIRSRGVLLTKRGGLLRTIALTPADPDGFVAAVGRGVERARASRVAP
jgi:hypothetical protein